MKKIVMIIGLCLLSLSLVACSNSEDTNTLLSGTNKEFTLVDLSEYTGANGSTAYIAVNGVVYDVTDEFSNGKHQGMQLGGTDATSVFASSPHSQSFLNQLDVVGVLVTAYTQNDNTSNEVVSLPVFTIEELANYTGANGSTAYIAVNGVVYDVTNEFINGTHQGMLLGGTDATAVFATSPHSQSFLSQLTIVGSLEGFPVISETVQVTNPYDDDENEYEDEDETEYEDEDETEYEDD